MLESHDEPRKAVLTAADAIGQLVGFYGYKEVMGRVWALLFLWDEPLCAPDISEILGISAGTCSTTLNELFRLGLIERTGASDGRRQHYKPVTDLWRAASNLLLQREDKQLRSAIDLLRQALDTARRTSDSPVLRSRIRELAGFLVLIRLSLRLLITTGSLSIKPLSHQLGSGQYAAMLKGDREARQFWNED